ncbi:aspartyl/asparaginyl beta-hydroxylase domain-containing protein [Brasilonema sp. CT11]|nr:aspartyl/asparaginyl beta-hydroxylase domain-containing protein [Brasilonema sp. CT11]
MTSLYGVKGKKYLATLLICQLGLLLFGFLSILLFVLKIDGIWDISYTFISLPLFFLYGILALNFGLFWQGFSEIIFNISTSSKIIFQRYFIIPVFALCLLGAYATHALLLFHPVNNNFVVTFAPLFLAGVLGIFATSLVMFKVFWEIKKDEETYIWSKRQLAKFKENFGSEAIRRIELSTDMAYGIADTNALTAQQGFVVTGLTSKPWYEIIDIPKLKMLEDSYEIIRQETLLAIKDKKLRKPYYVFGVSPDGWDWIELLNAGKKVEKNIIHFPQTLKLIENLSSHIRFVHVQLSFLEPGKVIKPHRSEVSYYLSSHLGLVIPEKCGISVAGDSRTWQEGKCIIFDDSYEHAAWNYSDSLRIVLFLIFYHPELTDVEMDFLHLLEFGDCSDEIVISSEHRASHKDDTQKKVV